MAGAAEVDDTAEILLVALGRFIRRWRQVQRHRDLSLGESSALSQLVKQGPSTSAALARAEQVSPQSMGAILAALEGRGLIERQADPTDGRQVLLSPSRAGTKLWRARRADRSEQLTQALSQGFTAKELAQLRAAAPLLDRLAQRL